MYNPGIQNRSGELLAQGINQFGQGVSQGLQMYSQNKTMTSQAIGKFEGALQANPDLAAFLDPEQPHANAPQEAVKAYAKLQKDGAVGLRDAALLSTFADSYQTAKDNKQKQQLQEAQMQQQQFMLKEAQQKKAEEDALNEKLGQYARIGQQLSGPNADMIAGPGGYDKNTLDSVKQFMGSPIADVVNSGGRVTPTMLADYALKTKPAIDSREEVANIRGEAAKNALELRQTAADAQAEARTTKAENDAIKAGKKDSAQDFEETKKLRDEFSAHPNTKNFDIVDNYYSRGQKLAKKETAAGDMGLIFSLMKVYDPSSTVREGEYATASNSGSIPDQFLNIYNKAKDGQKLQPEQRAQFLDTMKDAAGVQYQKLMGTANQYVSIAKKRGLDPEEVIAPSYTKWSPDGVQAPAAVAPAPVQPIKILGIKRVN